MPDSVGFVIGVNGLAIAAIAVMGAYFYFKARWG